MRVPLKITKQMVLLALMDAVFVTLAGLFALLARFEFSFRAIPRIYSEMWASFLPVQIGVTIVIFWLRKMYNYVWRSVSANDVSEMIVSVLIAFAVCSFVGYMMGVRLPRSVLFIMLLLEAAFLAGGRCFFRFWQVAERHWHERDGGLHRIMLIGAGQAGGVLAREFAGNAKLSSKVCCAIDDNPAKWGKYLEGIPIVGGRDRIVEAAKQYRISHIVLSLPAASAEQRKEILEICKQTNCRVQIVPGIYQLVNGEVSVSAIKDVQIEDLLGRESVRLDTAVLEPFLGDKTVLITGGGGSIGSELCRQIAQYHPRRVIIVDSYENNAYEIQQELKRKYGASLDLVVLIASVRDKERVYSIFETYRPNIVFHAAAHKHVPLMENCPAEAVKNNIFGTFHVVRASEKYGVDKFVMISTDKAVNPTNFMGATKRFCEMILQSRPKGKTAFCAVRFGNVLGSNGSVVPLFKEQIKEGGPVTITDKRIIRYFMTIPEAAQLVLQAGAMAKDNQVFVLDMGEPVKILDLAENLIRLSGFEPYKDIDIREIGLRPGEKLYEELLMRSETLSATENKKIFIEQQQPIDPQQIMQDLVDLDRAVTQNIDNVDLIRMLQGMIPTYHDPEEVNRRAIDEMAEVDGQLALTKKE